MKKFGKIFVNGLLLTAMLSGSACSFGGGGDSAPDNIVADKYKITVACQTEMGEEEVLKVLEKAYEAKNPDVDVVVKTFSGEGFEQYMLGIAAEPKNSPNIIWTADTYHSQWDQYFTDLRPYYEASPETDYSLYYETMLDTASTNGTFKPTKNYTNPTGNFNREKDANSDGKEDYKNHSEYGLYYAPRDYNKPAILCNTHLFAELDEVYERIYKGKEGITEMPADYKSATARLNEIVDGADWDELNDLYTFTKFIADKIAYIVTNASSVTGDRQLGRVWGQRVALNLFLEWEPTYTTILNAMGAELMTVNNGQVSLNLSNYETQLEAMHKALFPDDASKAYMMTTNGGVQFSSGNLLMSVCSRPVVLGYSNTFKGSYGDTYLETIQFPVEEIAAGNSGYAISNIWDGKGMTVNGVYKSYNDLSWDFIKFIITEEGQEAAGKTGLNIPVLKSLYDDGEWRKVEALGSMDHDAWVAGGELQQKTYNIFKPEKRMIMRNTMYTFFANFQMETYNEGSLSELITKTQKNFNNQNPNTHLLGK